jgi:hypothetical protein
MQNILTHFAQLAKFALDNLHPIRHEYSAREQRTNLLSKLTASSDSLLP